MTLLPTPVAQPSGNTPEDHLRKKPGREVVTDLAIIAENGLIETGGRLLPTPRTTDMNGPGAHGTGGMDLRTAVTLMPTPTAADSNSSGGSSASNVTLTDAVVRTELGAKPNERHLESVRLLPTPLAGRPDARQSDSFGAGRATFFDIIENVKWGMYEPAIKRWSALLGRPAPAPVRNDGRNGKPRLNPELTEWMMGWPAGHVTDPAIGLSRAEQLKACGNGVVPQQAAAALREMLTRPGVPAVTA